VDLVAVMNLFAVNQLCAGAIQAEADPIGA
jgi:hypothetical protein